MTGVGCFNDAHIVAVHPALGPLTDADVSNWFCSVHEAIDSFDPAFLPLVIANGISGPGSLNFADGSFGIPYIVARGEELSPILCGNGILEPPEECDDGNTTNGDGCSAQCTIEGLAQLVPTGNECDDVVAGTAQDLVMTINKKGRTAPGTFFYYNVFTGMFHVTVVVTQTVTPAGEPLANVKGAKVFILVANTGKCMNITRKLGVMISIAGGVVTFDIPTSFVDASQGNTVITRVEYKSPKAQVGTEFCFSTTVNGLPILGDCTTVVNQ